MEIVGLYVYAYLLGAVPTGYLIGKLVRGIDIRQYGSGHVGGTNIASHVGKSWLVPLLFFDIFIKGSSPVLIGHYLVGLERTSLELVMSPVLAVAGHNWSVFLRFQGGRGVAVLGGGLLALSPLVFASVVLVFCLGWALTRSSGVWVLLSLALLPVWVIILGEPTNIIWFGGGITALVVLKRLVSNWTPLPQDLPRKKVLLNRLFRDRDVDDRAEWVQRTPEGTTGA